MAECLAATGRLLYREEARTWSSGVSAVHRSAASRFRFRTPFAALLGLLLGAAPFPFARSIAAPAPAAPAAAPRGPQYVDGEVLLVFQPDARPEEVRAILRDLGATRIHTSRRSRVERHRIRKTVAEAIARYRNHPAVRIIEPNYLLHADVVPNDPSFPIQWSLQNTGQQGGTPGADIHAVAAWDQTTGSNQVVVAIIDTGIDLTHPDLVANLYTNPGEIPGNGLDDDGNNLVDDVHGFDFANFDGDPSDDNGHGTHVAGTIGAQGNNGLGVAGVVWHARLLPLKFLDAGGTGTTADAVDCVDYAVLAGASVINASWGSSERSQALELAISGANDEGVLFVTAAGNTGSNNDVFGNYPASFPERNVIAVGASSQTDGRASFSNYGPAGVDLFAPGVQILSTLPGDRYGLSSGTSMSAPHVSGALALLKSRFPGMGAPTMKDVLMAATDRVPALAGLCVSGGRLNASRILEGVDSTSPGPIVDLASRFISSDRVSLAWTATGDDGAGGTATEYELRYATTPIDAASFSAATRAAASAPRAAGSPEAGVIRRLAPLTEYFVAILARDEFGNASPVSNVIVVRTTAPPVAAVDPVSVESALLTGQRQEIAVNVTNDGAGALDFSVRALGAAGGPPPAWLSVAPAAGSAISGGRFPITVTMSAQGLRGGDYPGLVRLATNDPAHDTLDVPVAMHVTSAPDLDVDPASIVFGPVAVGNSDTQELFVTNSGFADLHVGSITIEGSDFSADPAGFDLAPGQSWDLFVTAAPTRTGSLTGALVLASDDPDQPVVRVPLAAGGIIPSVAAIAPSRQEAALHTGQTTTRSFTISNSGGSSLSWSLRPRSAASLAFDSTGALGAPAARASEPGAPSVAAAAIGVASSTADISDVRIVFDARHGASSGAWSDLIGSLTSRGVLFTLNTRRLTAGVLAGADVYWISDDAGALGADERAALAAWVRAGGSLLLEGAAAAALPEFNALLDSTGVPLRYDPGEGITGPTTRIYPFEITRGIGTTDMPSSTARLHVEGAGPTVLIEDGQGFTTVAAVFVERGRVLAVAGRLFADVSSIFADNRKAASQAFDWLGGAAWLSVSPAFGSVGAGLSTAVTVTFDAAQLAAADYRGALAMRTNDPDRADLLLSVNLSVAAAPDVQAAPLSLDLGSVFVGASRRDSTRVRNVGVLPLRVLSASLDHPDFAAAFDTLTLAPGAAASVGVTYTPASVGPASANLTIRTDDPDQPETAVHLVAAGAPAPDIAVIADGVNASLETGGTASRTLTVANRAGSPLQYSIHLEEDAPAGASGSAAGTTRAAALPRTWSEARESALALHRRSTEPVSGVAGGAGSAAAAAPDSLPLVVLDPQGDGSVVDLIALHAWARGGILSVRLETSNDITPLNCGGYVSLDLDQNRNTGRAPSFGSPRQDIGAEFEVSLFSVGFGVVDLLDAATGNYVQSFPVETGPRSIAFSVPLSWLDSDDGRINATGVIGNFVGATDWFPDRGHGTIGGLWLAAEPASGTVASGTESTVMLTLDALGLPAGGYRGTIVVESNDPDESRLEVPASIDVTDAPIIAATATSVHLGTVFLGRHAEGELRVGNQGRAALTVSSVATGVAEFTATPASFTVPPGGAETVHLTFTPAAEGPRAATLTLLHDAAGHSMAIALTGEGRAPPSVQVEPPSLQTSIALGERGSAAFSIRNRGGSPLDYGVEPLNGAPVAPQAGLVLGRDEEDPREGMAPLGLGGPDGFGYRWVDSNQAGGPVFDWQDIAAIGTPVPIRTLDQNSGPLPIGFTFPFYGREFTTFNVCTHGWISFTDTTVQFANQPLPTTAAPNNLLAVFWDDLNFGGVERASYYNDGTRLIVQFTNVPRRQRGGPFTFQAILYPSGAIVYQYLLLGPPVDSGTIGIQNRTKSDGLTVVFNTAYLHDRMAIRLSAAPTWLSVAERFGSVAPGDSVSVGVGLDSRGLFAGDYHGVLRVQTNDPDRPETLIPVGLHATGVPRLAFSPATFRFDTLEVGQAATDTLRVTNQGTDRLEASIAFDRPDFTAAPAALSLAPLQSAAVLVRFAPTTGGDRSGTLHLVTNDPAAPETQIPVGASARLSVRQLTAELVPAVIRRGSNGREIRARIVMPADLDAASIELAGIRLQGIVPPRPGSTRLRDLDGDGRPDLDLAFDRSAVERALPTGDAVPVAITGATRDGTRFEARGLVRVFGTALAAPGVEFDEEGVPAASAMRASAPNPFTAGTALRFDLAAGGGATLRVYAAQGRLVRTIFRTTLPAGRFRAAWDGRDDQGRAAPSGIYFTRLEVSGAVPFRGVGRVVRVR